MACFSPLDAWQTDDGEVVFAERGSIRRALQLPCGQCVGCRLERSRQWAVRCMHEAQMHDENSFVTLTYDDAHLPADGGLHYREFQLFMKRLRKEKGRARFYMAGEYGDKFGRPHFHACLFGVGFADRDIYRTLPSGHRLYVSAQLGRLWPFGFSSIGDVTFQSAAYVARYVMKKITGQRAEKHYERVDAESGEIFRVVPEFNHMSLRPGIGASWLDEFGRDVYPHGYVVVNGVKARPPKYYDARFEAQDGFAFEYLQFLRSEAAKPDENTPERLRARETVTRARVQLLKRTVE